MKIIQLNLFIKSICIVIAASSLFFILDNKIDERIMIVQKINQKQLN
jgi:hypothetical protein